MLRLASRCAFLCLIAPLAALAPCAPCGSRREAAYFVVARRRKGVSAHSSAARRRAIRCTRPHMEAVSADSERIPDLVRRNDSLLGQRRGRSCIPLL
jgi:hypothetical protein